MFDGWDVDPELNDNNYTFRVAFPVGTNNPITVIYTRLINYIRRSNT